MEPEWALPPRRGSPEGKVGGEVLTSKGPNIDNSADKQPLFKAGVHF